ncbi:unnamed protein product, partial [Meganyctiphanes norvegica]
MFHQCQPGLNQTPLDPLLLNESVGEATVVIDGEALLLLAQPCPELLLPATADADKIILIQKFNQACHTKNVNFEFPKYVPSLSQNDQKLHQNGPKKKKYITKNINLDVTGSPLKCPFNLDDDTTDFSPFTIAITLSRKRRTQIFYVPVPSAKATKIGSQLHQVLEKSTAEDQTKYFPVWIVCDGTDSKGTLFLGIQKQGNQRQRMIVTSSGPHLGEEKLPTLDHLKIHHTSTCSTNRVDTSVTATYEVLPQALEEEQSSSVSLLCTWKRPLRILEPPARDAFTTAKVEVACSDPRSAAHQMYQELNLLKGFILSLTTKEVRWFVRDDDDLTVGEELENIFNSIRDKDARKADDDAGASFDIMIEGKFFNRRQNMDFTDTVWTALMKCESYQELKESLIKIFHAINAGQVRPQIHVRNLTQVGCVARNLMRGQGEIPELEGLEPLEMLIEIGIEKLKRDYINIFQGGELATGEHLSWYVKAVPGEIEAQESLMKLSRLHCALQAVVILRTYLNLPTASLTQYTVQVKKKENPPGMFFFYYKFGYGSYTLLPQRLQPSTWEVTFNSSEGIFEKMSVCRVARKPLINLESVDKEGEMTQE